MKHYTLNTDHTRVSPRSEVQDDVIKRLRPLCRTGLHAMPAPKGYYCNVTAVGHSLMATVLRKNNPCVTFGVAVDEMSATELWGELEKLYLDVGDMPHIRAADFAAPHKPKTTPWCAAVVILCNPSEALWIADFERCLAWSWIEHCKENR